MFRSHHHLNDSLNENLYPELARSNGLGFAFTEIMAQANPNIYITKPYKVAYANASGSNGSVHLTLRQAQRMFICEIRRGGLSIGRIHVSDLSTSVKIFDKWLGTEITSAELSQTFPNIIVRPDIALFEGVNRYQITWNVSLYLGGAYRDLLYLVHHDPNFKGTLPRYSMGMLYFTGGPFQYVETPIISEEIGVYYFYSKRTNEKSDPMNAYEAYLRIKSKVDL